MMTDRCDWQRSQQWLKKAKSMCYRDFTCKIVLDRPIMTSFLLCDSCSKMHIQLDKHRKETWTLIYKTVCRRDHYRWRMVETQEIHAHKFFPIYRRVCTHVLCLFPFINHNHLWSWYTWGSAPPIWCLHVGERPDEYSFIPNPQGKNQEKKCHTCENTGLSDQPVRTRWFRPKMCKNLSVGLGLPYFFLSFI